MAATDPPGGGTKLSKGDVIAGARLIEPLARGERVDCWRALRSDGEAATVHALTGPVHAREKENFLKGARKLAVLTRNRPLPGLVDIVTVVPNIPAYLARGGTAGTMEDVTILGWGVRETITFMRRLCRAVRVLHDGGIAHGCLRPANVLLDDDLNPRLSDGGMIVLDDSYDGPSDMKHDYAAYAAREVRLGKKADVRSDVFSIGRLLYFALHGEEPEATDEDTPMLAALEHAPPGLVRIIRRATLRAPEGRYESVGALMRDLENWREADQVGVQHPLAKEGGEDIEPSAPTDSDPPSYPDRPSRNPSGRPSDSNRAPPPVEERKPAEIPIRSYHAPTQQDDDDIISTSQGRIGGAIGLVVVCGALLAAYTGAVASDPVVIATLVGAVWMSLGFPPVAAPVPSRLINALVFGLVAWYLDPATLMAEKGRLARISRGSAVERGAAVFELRAKGIRDFSGVDLRGVDFTGLNLAAVSFDRCKLNGASFVDAQLTGTTFAAADISAANFSGAELTGVDVVRATGWLSITCSEGTTMPVGWFCDEGVPYPEALLPPEPVGAQR